MQKVKTTNFELAIHTAGNSNSQKLALLLPGRLETKDYIHLRSHAEHLASLGYYAVAFDPPGTWESAGDISLYTATNYLAATHELIAHFGNRPTLLLGHSLGGSIAMLAAFANPCVTSFVAIMSWVDITPANAPSEAPATATFYRDLPPGNTPSKLHKKFVVPRAPYQKFDIAAGLQSYKKPKLFVMGTFDDPLQSEQVKLGYELSVNPKQFFELRSGHGYRYDPEAIKAMNNELTTFIGNESPSSKPMPKITY